MTGLATLPKSNIPWFQVNAHELTLARSKLSSNVDLNAYNNDANSDVTSDDQSSEDEVRKLTAHLNFEYTLYFFVCSA